MQRVHLSRAGAVRRGRSLRRRQEPDPAGAERDACATRLTAIAPAFGQGLPSLDGIALAYSHEFQAELIYELCAALVREGLGTPKGWNKCGENAVAFAQQAVMTAIGEDRWNLLKRNVEYHLSVSDLGQQDKYDTAFERGRLLVTIECGGSGYLNIGPAVDALEAEAEGLGAAFYWTLTHALYRVMRVYNHDDALQYEERMREYAEEEGESNDAQYEFPEVDKALPACIQKTLTHDERNWIFEARRLLRAHQNGRHRSWIERLRHLQKIAGVAVGQTLEYLQSGNYDSEPLPCLLISFKEHDAITACFDEEGQYMMEGSCEPSVCVVFSPSRPEEVRQAIRAVARFITFNQALFELIEELQKGEKTSCR